MGHRTASLALLAALALSAGGCNLYYGVIKIFSTRDRAKIEGPVPDDLRVGIEVSGIADPPVDYKLTVDRSGAGTFNVTVRAPRRRHVEGEIEISDDQVVRIWNEMVKHNFGDMDDRYPSSGDGTNVGAGTQRFYVFANGAEMTIQGFHETNETLDAVRTAIAAAFPKETLKARAAAQEAESSKGFVGDTQTKLFHTPDCPLLKDTPEERRRTLASWYDALDYRFQPCPECRPSAPPAK